MNLAHARQTESLFACTMSSLATMKTNTFEHPKGLSMALDAHEEWHRKRFPQGPRFFFPGRVPNSHLHRTCMTNLLKKLWKLPEGDPRHTRKWFTSHVARALFVWICRRCGIQDDQTAWTIDHTGDLDTLRESYGRAPEHRFNGEAPLPKDYDWVPKCEPCWTKINYENVDDQQVSPAAEGHVASIDKPQLGKAA